MALVSVLTLRARDEASAVVNRLAASLGNLNGVGVRGAETGMRSLVGQITQGVVQANLIGTALTSATSAIQRGIGVFQNTLAEGSQLQLSNMTTASSIAAMTNQSFEDSAAMVDRLNQTLAVRAAALPGETAGFQLLARQISDQVLPAFKGLDGAVNVPAFEKGLLAITESYGVLAAGAGLDFRQASFGLSRALGGSSLAELKQFEFFQELPQVTNYLEEELKKMGKELKDLDPAARLKLLQEASDKFVTPEFKARAAETVDGLLQSFKSGLLDPVSGAFGYAKDLDLSTEGVQSVFSRFNETLRILIGSDGIFSIASSLLNKLGLTIDPMKLIDSGLARVNTALTGIKGFLGNLQGVATAGADLDDVLRLIPIYIGGFKNRITQGLDRFSAAPIGEMLGNLFNRLTSGAASLLSKVDGRLVGGAIGRFVGIAFNHLTTLISTIDFGALIGIVGVGFGKLLSGIVSGLVSAAITLDTKGWAVIILGALGAVMIPAVVSAAGAFAAAIGGWLLAGMMPAVTGVILPPIIMGATQLAVAIGAGLAGLPFGLIAILAVALVGTFVLLARVINEHKQQIMGLVQQFFAPFASFFSGMSNLFMGMMTGNLELAVAGTRRILESIVGMIQRVYDTVAAAIPGLPTSGEIASNQADARSRALLNAAGGANQPVFNWTPSGSGVRNRANGQIPNAAGGLMAAAAREARAMPSGAEIVVANSTETIIPAQNVRSASAVGSTTLNLGGIHIHGISDPAAIADQVVREIQARFDAARQARLA